MANKPSAIVIGAGIGGTATAGRLARNGYDVMVVEKNSNGGGRCNQIVKDGHRFDVGPTLFLMPEVFEETYAALGEKMSEHLDLKRIDPTYTVRFDDGTSLALTSNIGAMQPQLEAIEPGAFGGFLRYLGEGQLHYRLSLEKFVGRNFYHYFDYFSLGNLPLLFKLKALVKHYDNVDHYFKNPRLKARIRCSATEGSLTVEEIVQNTNGTLSERDIYLCGPLPMIQAFEKKFIALGVPQNNIHYEEFNFR